MPRKHENARQKPRIKSLKGIKQPKAVMIWIDTREDDITPGKLVAAAEWRDGSICVIS